MLHARPEHDYRLDLTDACLWRANERLPLRPRTFDVLECLVQSPQQLVSKQRLLDTVWPSLFVTETVLAVCVSELRQALGDSPRQPIFIETVHRRGYRYIGHLPIVGSPCLHVHARCERHRAWSALVSVGPISSAARSSCG